MVEGERREAVCGVVAGAMGRCRRVDIAFAFWLAGLRCFPTRNVWEASSNNQKMSPSLVDFT